MSREDDIFCILNKVHLAQILKVDSALFNASGVLNSALSEEAQD